MKKILIAIATASLFSSAAMANWKQDSGEFMDSHVYNTENNRPESVVVTIGLEEGQPVDFAMASVYFTQGIPVGSERAFLVGEKNVKFTMIKLGAFYPSTEAGKKHILTELSKGGKVPFFAKGLHLDGDGYKKELKKVQDNKKKQDTLLEEAI